MENKRITIGTRGSKLALKQADIVKDLLINKFPDYSFEIKIIKTKGDTDLDMSLLDDIYKSMFVKEIEEELQQNTIDIAVHSMKDMPLYIKYNFIIGAVCERVDPRDVLISKNKKKFNELPADSIIGTSSVRRLAQLKSLRKDLQYKEIRGNIDTRISKMKNGEYDAIVLAAAGVHRLGLKNTISDYFRMEDLLPAPAQAAIGVECRKNDFKIRNMLSEINDANLETACLAEREFANAFDGGCKTPLACYGEIKDEKLILKGMYFTKGHKCQDIAEGEIKNYSKTVEELIEKIKEQFNVN